MATVLGIPTHMTRTTRTQIDGGAVEPDEAVVRASSILVLEHERCLLSPPGPRWTPPSARARRGGRAAPHTTASTLPHSAPSGPHRECTVSSTTTCCTCLPLPGPPLRAQPDHATQAMILKAFSNAAGAAICHSPPASLECHNDGPLFPCLPRAEWATTQSAPTVQPPAARACDLASGPRRTGDLCTY